MRRKKRTLTTIGFLMMLVLGFGLSFQSAIAGDGNGFVGKGSQLYKQHCASCHGIDARGHGPATPALKTIPPDLTMIQREGEAFPTYQVMTVIEGEKVMPAHGDPEMPVWGMIFRRTKGAMQQQGDVYSLMKYIESIQVHGQ